MTPSTTYADEEFGGGSPYTHPAFGGPSYYPGSEPETTDPTPEEWQQFFEEGESGPAPGEEYPLDEYEQAWWDIYEETQPPAEEPSIWDAILNGLDAWMSQWDYTGI